MSGRPSPDDRERLLALALAGDRQALAFAIEEVDPERDGTRIAVVLARDAVRADPPLDPPPALRALRKRVAAIHLLLERDLASIARSLAGAGVAWAPFKGIDVAYRLYDDPATRSMTDLDVLVAERDFRLARAAFEADGWRDAAPGTRFARYVETEGTAWTGSRAGSPLPVELHLRLWGFLPRDLGDTMLERAAPDPSLGATGRRLRLEDAFVLAAVHPWTHLPPRSLANWWELRRFLQVGGRETADDAAEVAEATGLHLPVHLSAARVATLWDDPLAVALAARLERGLRPSERSLARRARRRHPNHTSIEAVAFARLLARRPSRSGLKPVLRRVWAHPGIVERLTPEEWGWPRRRAVHVLQCVGLLPRPRADWWRAPTHGHRAPPTPPKR